MLHLYREQTLVARLTLGERPLEVGRAATSDLVLDDPEIAERHWLLMRQSGTVMAYDVSPSRAKSAAFHVPYGEPLALGAHYTLVRQQEDAAVRVARGVDRDTEALRVERLPPSWLGVVVGRGSSARTLRIRDKPVHVGRGAHNELVIADRAASATHCRLEPCGLGLLVRDLGSSNGTLVNGVRVETALLKPGSQLRIGRTEMFVVARDADDKVIGTQLVAEAPAMLAALADVERAAQLDWPALVLGESGTGKEGVACMLHERGSRRGRAFVTLNAGGVPSELVESELFGHERGAFTGASTAHRGVFEQADGGTLFLDEIGELPLAMQARLLRVLETGEIRRVGAESARRVDVRLVCATHRDLRAMAGAGQFRSDLYFRIARQVIELPPLRARPQDVGAIAVYVLRSVASVLGPKTLSVEALARLRAYDWPGNVRELRNVVSAAAAMSAETVGAEEVEQALARVGAWSPPVTAEAIEETVQRCAGNLTAAARMLGMPRTTLRARLRRSLT